MNVKAGEKYKIENREAEMVGSHSFVGCLEIGSTIMCS
jgi:hypothetical protein